MKLHVKSAILAATLAAFATSCSDSPNDDEITNQTLSGYFNIVTDIATGQSEVFTGVSYTLEYNYSKGTAVVLMSGLRLPRDVAYPTMSTGTIKWTADKDGWKNISVPTVLMTATNFGNLPKISDFNFNLLDKWFGENSYTCATNIRYIVDDMYSVVSLPIQSVELGTTTVKTKDSFVDEYQTEKSVYIIELDPEKNLANLTINHFSMTVEQDILAVAIKDIPYTVDATGKVTLEAAQATARIVGVVDAETSKMSVRNLSAVIDRGVFVAAYTLVDGGTTYQVSVK